MLKSIETLRIISAFLVVLAHTNGLSIFIVGRFLNVNYFLGSVGVDIFFVISGFVMYLAAQKVSAGYKEAINFLIKRLIRVLPLYFLITVFYAYKIDLLNFESLLKSLLLVPVIENHMYADPILILGWTLRFELFFYALVAIGIFTNSKIIIPGVALIISVILWFYYNFYFGAPIVIEFLYGYAIGYWYVHKNKKSEKKLSLTILCFMMTIVLMLLVARGRDWGQSIIEGKDVVTRMWIEYTFNNYKIIIARFIAWGIPSALLVYFALRLEKTFKWRLSILGQYTYSVYLLQIFTTSIPIQLKGKLPDLILLIISILTLLVLSILVHYFLDNQIRRYLMKVFFKKQKLISTKTESEF